MSRRVVKPARVGLAGGRIAWIAWDRRHLAVREVLGRWVEPPAPWDGAGERCYARLLLETGAVLDAFLEDGRWRVCAMED
jgi:hypothetical protein